MARKYKSNRASWVKRGATQEEREEAQFQAYKRAYQRQADKVGGREDMASPEIQDKETFLAMHEAYKNELKKDVRYGKRQAVGNVIQYMVRDQAYEVSYKQAEALKDYIEKEYKADLMEMGFVSKKAYERGELKLSREGMLSLRRGELARDIGVYDDISDMYHRTKDRLIRKGLSPHDAIAEAKEIITNTFFYPKERK